MQRVLTILIPAYNEVKTVSTVISQIIELDTGSLGFDKQIIVIDDGSTDGTYNAVAPYNNTPIQIIQHAHNLGKSEAIRSGIVHSVGDYVVIQDADTELMPKDIVNLLSFAQRHSYMVVYGSRNLTRHSSVYFWYGFGGKFLTRIFNILYKQSITDLNTCYKLIDTKLLKEISLVEDGFGFCAEVSAKIANKGIKIHEIPIAYTPRSFSGGKKIRVWDGIYQLWILIKFAF